MIATIFFALVFAILGIIGGITAVSRWARGYSGFRLLEVPWGLYFGMALVFSGTAALSGVGHLDGILLLLFIATVPFAVLGSVMWFFAFVLAIFSCSSDRGMHLDPSYDIGDGLMARRQFADAEAAYRLKFAEDPADTGVILRICKAQVADGRIEQALRELEALRRHAIERTDDAVPPRPALTQKFQEKEFRQDRILRLSFTLGDLYVEKLNDNTRAEKLYEETLEFLFGYPPADPLRDRLKALKRPDRLSIEQAVEQAQPRKISLQ